MTTPPRPIAPGLHLIATPIGAARDITLRALDLLEGADMLAAEDTRSLRRLMEMHGISLRDRRILPYHDHNGAQMRPHLIAALREGKSIVYASEAGTPLVADPGYQLARSVVAEGLALHSAPGPSAVLAALTLSGLPSDRFCFVGFAPTAQGARRKWLAEICAIPATLILYESPKRIHQILDDLCEIAGAEREAALCRELTKLHEEVIRCTLGEMRAQIAGRVLKGEIVLLLGRAVTRGIEAPALEDMLRQALSGDKHLKDVVAEISALTGLARRQVYQAALAIEQDKENDR
jgi:16S rRNA (cytidine1402-2'-O)-methyltransferase